MDAGTVVMWESLNPLHRKHYFGVVIGPDDPNPDGADQEPYVIVAQGVIKIEDATYENEYKSLPLSRLTVLNG